MPAEGPQLSEKAALLARTDLFAALASEDLETLAAMARRRSLESEAPIFRKDDPSSSLYVIERGRVKISSGSREGREVVLNLLGPGSIFGEVALVDGGGRTADATACDPTSLLVLERGQLIPFLERQPALLLRMLVTLTARLRWVSDRLEDTVFLSLAARLAKRLLFLGEHFGVDTPRGRRLTVSLPQRELASHMNVTRETMNRLLQDWMGQGLIEIHRGFIVLKDAAALARIVEAG